jgi:D-alanine-D-alanine ligase
MPGKRPRVLVLHAAPPAGNPAAWRESDAGVMAEVEAVVAALGRLGLEHRIAGAGSLADVPALLAAAPEEIVFNLVEGFAGAQADAVYVPALGRAFGKAVTGSDSPCLTAALDKWETKALLRLAGLPTPEAMRVAVGQKVRHADLFGRGPYIVKPTHLDASEGIDGASVVAGFGAALSRAVRRVHTEFRQPALVERFVEGRELNVSVLQRGRCVEVLPIAEIDFSAFPKGRPRIVDYRAKWEPESPEYRGTPRVIPAPISAAQDGEVRRLALAAWHALGCRGYARVDFRLDRRGLPLILEVNPNPDISPDAGFAAALSAADISFDEFVEASISAAVADGPAQAARPSSAGGKARAKRPGIAIRRVEPRDRDTVLNLLERTGFFRPDEILIAQEVLDESLAKGPEGDYQSFVADVGGRAVGWVCYGPTPCTLGTFDIYWIGVDPKRQGRGIGAALMEFAEEGIVHRGGRLSIVETSGRAIYDSTRQFYLRIGYPEACRIADFYAPGDDKVVYAKRLSGR